MKKKTRGKLQFSKKWKIAIFLSFFSFFSFFYHFFFQWRKNFPKNGKLQLSSSFFHFLSFFLIIFASNWWKMIKNDEKCSKKIKNDKNMIKKWKKYSRIFEENCNFPKNEKLQFSSRIFHFFSVFFIFFIFFHFFHLFIFFLACFLSFFIIFASSGAKIFRKIKKTIFLDVFSYVYLFFHFCFELMKNDKKWWKMIKKWKKTRGKLQFSKKWKIAIFLEFFSFFFICFLFFSFVYHFFIIVHHFCFQWCKTIPKNKKTRVFFIFSFFFNIVASSWWKMMKHDKND